MFLDGEDIECCLAVPSVGEAVRWSLIWSDEPDHPAAVDVPWTGTELRLGDEESRHIGVASGFVLTAGRVSAWWRGAGGRALPLRGVLSVGVHGFVPEAVPPTRGRAGEVSLVIGTDRETGRGHWEAVPDATATWPIAEGGGWDDREEFAALAGPLPAGHERSPRGVLVVVDVTR
ncbi:hypothetical protein ACI79J_15870 [Geodermatophilus sp. SYSU D01062]